MTIYEKNDVGKIMSAACTCQVAPPAFKDLCQNKSLVYFDFKTHHKWYHRIFGVTFSVDELESHQRFKVVLYCLSIEG
jgi:hypothetical protein